MPFFYCKSWFRAKKIPRQRLDQETAFALHEAGLPYTVLVDSEGRPMAFIELTAKSVLVGFLDAQMRERLSYTFKLVETGKLFLSMATYREFSGESDAVVSGTNYVFQEDGALSIDHRTYAPPTTEVTNSSTDVSDHYEKFPEFGRYAPLLKTERS